MIKTNKNIIPSIFFLSHPNCLCPEDKGQLKLFFPIVVFRESANSKLIFYSLNNPLL